MKSFYEPSAQPPSSAPVCPMFIADQTTPLISRRPSSSHPASPQLVQPSVTPCCYLSAHPLHRMVLVALADKGALHPTVPQLLEDTPSAYKERLRGCLASLNPGAGPASAPRSPPRRNLPTTFTPDRRLPHLGSPLRPQVFLIQSPGQPSIHCLFIHCLLSDHF